MATPIELYRKAYDLDYRRGDWQGAEEIYRQIVEKHPYSDEKEYALVHLDRLEKLRADPRDQALQPVRAAASTVNGFNVVNFALVLVVAVATGMTAYLLWQQRKDLLYHDLLLRGLLGERTGNYIGAADLYKQAQALLPAQAAAYRCLAELYLDRKQFKLADIEGKRWAVADPSDEGLTEFRTRLNAAVAARDRR